MHPLDGPREKIKWAKRHIDWLKCDIAREEADPHTVIEYPEGKTGSYRYEIADPLGPPEWGLAVGDIVHNLHNALDHVVWQLALRNKRGKQAAAKRGQLWPPTNAAFPIYKDEPGFQRDGLNKIACVHKRWQRKIERHQPYKRSPVPDTDSIWLLYAISITDKHHVLNTSVFRLAEAPDKPFRIIKTDPETGDLHAYYSNEDGRFESMEVIAHVGMGTAGYTTVKAKGQFPIEVTLSDPGSRFGPDIDGQVVMPLMEDAIASVEKVVASFEPAFR